MQLFDYVLELADGSQIQIGASPYTNSPVVMKTDVPAGRLPAFTATNPPKGHKATNETTAKNVSQVCR